MNLIHAFMMIGPFELILFGLAAVIALLAVFGAVFVSKPRGQQTDPPPSLFVDINQLQPTPLPAHGLVLECHHVPTRIMVMVLAPVGRGGFLPQQEQLPAAIDQIVPNLSSVVAEHIPMIKIWPPQLSPRGFAHAFFSNVPLPGAGKGTPWCAAGGRFEAFGQPFLAGFTLHADQSNGLGQYAIEQPAQWLDVFAVRNR